MQQRTSVDNPRQRYREQARTEAKILALEQLAEAGSAGISVNAIAKRMGVTGPALYRYFANREALLEELALDAHDDLIEAVEDAGRRHRRKGPAGRFREMAVEFRAWAMREPHRYLLLFGTHPPDDRDPAAPYRCIRPFLDVLAELASEPVSQGRSVLDRQLAAWWAMQHDSPLPPAIIRQGVLAWTRMHGLISLELQGQLADLGIRPELLFKAEVDSLLSA